MYERCLNEAERILASDKDVIVPVKRVWESVEKQGKKQGFEIPSFADFTALLEGDSRFEFLTTSDGQGASAEEMLPEDGLPDQEEELESLGFYSGVRVKLKSVELTPEIIGGLIRRKVDMTMDALARAWDRRPDGDQDTEDQLLDILAKTQKLQREVKSTFSEEKMKQLELVLQKVDKKKTVSAAKAASPKKKPRSGARNPKAKKPATKTRSPRTRRK